MRLILGSALLFSAVRCAGPSSPPPAQTPAPIQRRLASIEQQVDRMSVLLRDYSDCMANSGSCETQAQAINDLRISP